MRIDSLKEKKKNNNNTSFIYIYKEIVKKEKVNRFIAWDRLWSPFGRPKRGGESYNKCSGSRDTNRREKVIRMHAM